MSVPKFSFTALEIVKKGRSTTEDIQSLKLWLTETDLPKLTDEQIIIFLLCCNNDQEITKKIITSSYYWRRQLPELFDGRTLRNKSLRSIFNVIDVSVMPQRTSDNCIILIGRLNDTNYRNFNMELCTKALLMLVEAAIVDDPPDGLYVIGDPHGIGIMHLTKIRLRLAINILKYVQEAFHVKMKGIYTLNCNYVINKIFTLLKPFIHQEIVYLIKLFPSNMDLDAFYKDCLPRQCLPEDYGGYLPPMSVLHAESLEKLSNLEEHFEMEERQRKNL